VTMKVKNTLLLGAILLLVSHFPMLFNNGIYWDDWTLYNSDFEQLKLQFFGNGIRPWAYIHNFFLTIGGENSPVLYHILSFISFYLSFVFLTLIIKNLNTRYSSLLSFSSLLILVLPFFEAKTTMICIPYTVHTTFFLAATYFLIIYIQKKKIAFRIVSLVLFFFSFIVQSLLVFYVIPLFGVIFLLNSKTDNQNYLSISNSMIKIKSHLDFFLLPILFLIYKHFFLQTSGLYAENGYNKITLMGLLKAPFVTIKYMAYQFNGILIEVKEKVFSGSFGIVVFLIFGLIIFIFIKNNFRTKLPVLKNKEKLYLILIGFIFLFFAIFPYAVVGKIPSFYSFDTRHQLLVPFGFSLIIVVLCAFFVKRNNVSYLFLAIVISLFITTTFLQQIQYIKGWLKQESFANSLEYISYDDTPSTIFIQDNTIHLDATEGGLSFYNWTGILKLKKGKEHFFWIEEEEFNYLQPRLERLLLEKIKFNMADYSLSNPSGILIIDEGESSLKALDCFKYVFLYYYDNDNFRKSISKTISLKEKNIIIK
jgi:hypothetical protein